MTKQQKITPSRKAGRSRDQATRRGDGEPGRVERRRARVRQRVLKVAEELVRARGVDAVTLDEITDAAFQSVCVGEAAVPAGSG